MYYNRKTVLFHFDDDILRFVCNILRFVCNSCKILKMKKIKYEQIHDWACFYFLFFRHRRTSVVEPWIKDSLKKFLYTMFERQSDSANC